MRQPPSIFSARVFRFEASEPVSGSVSPKQPSASPEHSSRQPLLLLLLGAPADDRGADERGDHRDDGAHRRVVAPDLLDDQPVGAGSRRRGRRTPRARSRRGSPCRPSSARARCRSARCGRSRGRAERSRLSLKSRAVSRISRLLVGEFEVDHVFLILQDARGRVREAVMGVPPRGMRSPPAGRRSSRSAEATATRSIWSGTSAASA